MRKTIGNPFQRLYHRYLALRLPWRRKFLIGTDLNGNTFWESFIGTGSRPRRSVNFKTKNLDWVDYASAVSPQWHQWLRATRNDPPSIEEQVADLRRKDTLKLLAAEADRRWAAKAVIGSAGPPPLRGV